MRALPTSQMEVEEFGEEDDIIIVEEGEAASTSARDSRSKPLSSAKSIRDKNASQFPDDDFDFDDCEILVRPEKSQRFSIDTYIPFYTQYPLLCAFTFLLMPFQTTTKEKSLDD